MFYGKAILYHIYICTTTNRHFQENFLEVNSRSQVLYTLNGIITFNVWVLFPSFLANVFKVKQNGMYKQFSTYRKYNTALICIRIFNVQRLP